jgi:nucleoporin NDC1
VHTDHYTALWLWFPFGPTGIRTLMAFLPALIIYVLRAAQWHVGERQTSTQAQTSQKYLFRKATLFTLAFYLFSAWLFGEVYIWSRPSSSKLGFTDLGRAHDRMKLNERPFYIRYMFMALAVAQTIVHLWDDYDSIEVPAMKPKKDREETTAAASTQGARKPRTVLFNKVIPTLVTSGVITLAAFVFGTLFYFVGPRHLIWDYYYSFSRYFISLSKTSKPTGVAPFMPLTGGFLIAGTSLVFLWQFVNKAFDLYIALEPLKNGQPISSDSKDPNGTLLNGMKSKKDAVKVRSTILREQYPS